ncbi:hypothetical protein N9322_01630 [bacterium]|nr:hypothetical protein [bacterium]|tara:strand:+ start:8647 stop:10848 length:2202 start_codon:yes stop_codon:yes gene_type:complete
MDNNAINYFLKNLWPRHRSQLYSQLYNTYHPSTYTESFNRPSSEFENALEILADAVHEGKKLGLINSSVDWSDIFNYDALDLDSDEKVKRVVDETGLPTLHDQLEILDNTNLDWIHAILLFDVLEDIVDEFKSYCGENGVDESGMGKCMGEFPPSPNHEQINRTGGTLKQDYYTLFNFMKELDRAGIPVTEYMRSPLFPNIIKLVDDGSTDYDTTGEYYPNRQDDEAIDTEKVFKSFGVESDRIDEQYPSGDEMGTLERTMKDLKIQLKFVGTFGFGISGMFGMAKDLLEGKYPVLSETDITLIFLAAMVYMGVDAVDDVKKVFKMVNDRGLKKYITQTVDTLTDFKNIAIKVGEKAGFAISSLTELLGYTILLTPILDATTKLINEESLDIVTLGMYLKSALLSVGIFYVRNVFNNVIKRLRRFTDDEETSDEMLEEAYLNGKNVYKKYSSLLNEELVGELSLLDPSPINKNLEWIVKQHNKLNFTSENLVETLNKYNNNLHLFTNLEEKNLNSYKSLTSLNIKINKLVEEDETHTKEYMSKIAEKATTDVVRDIFEVITLFEGGEDFVMLPDYYTDKDGDDYKYGDLEFNVELNIVGGEQNGENYVLDSSMGGEYDNTIYVDVLISKNFSEKEYESLQIVLSEYVRHEIEHVLQVIDPERPDIVDKDKTMKAFDYYTQEHELDAQKVGFKRRAKMEDRPIDDVINDYIDYRQDIDNLTSREKNILVKKLTT